jgi:hypothetical protein
MSNPTQSPLAEIVNIMTSHDVISNPPSPPFFEIADEKIELDITEQIKDESESDDHDQSSGNDAENGLANNLDNDEECDVDPDVDSELEIGDTVMRPIDNDSHDCIPIPNHNSHNCIPIPNHNSHNCIPTHGSQNLMEVKAPSIFTWHGMRPFVGAVEQYITVLHTSIIAAKQQLAKNPKHSYAKVILPLFTTLKVNCTDQYGNNKVKMFAFHEAHYAPLIHNTNKNMSVNNTKEQKWAGFLNRYIYIWTLLGQYGKVPGGDGTGRGGTACSPFRDAQIALLYEGLYLIDGSDVVYDAQNGNARYNINIALYRTPPQNGPFRAAHGYGFIPYLGPVHHKNPVVQNPAVQNLMVQNPAVQNPVVK